MVRSRDTVDADDDASAGPTRVGRPGIVWIFERGAPACRSQSADARGVITIDRGAVDDERVSRPHAELLRHDGGWRIRDLGSRNGTFVDGQRVSDATVGSGVVRVGYSLGLLCEDLGDTRVDVRDGIVIGPALRRVLGAVERAARAGTSILIGGETGAGKELAARTFHQTSGRGRQPFVPVNCAAVPTNIAERLFFGARRGAYSGADSDAIGYAQAADGGVLFLDEVGELALDVQAKLLRLLDTRELLPLGATTAKRVDLLTCFATHRDLRAAVAKGTLRDDLFFRIAEPSVTLPPLRQRREEIPWLVAQASPLPPHALFVEACLLRRWPGNVRELVAVVRASALAAKADGASELRRGHLPDEAGRAAEATPAPSGKADAMPSKAAVATALAQHDGSVAAAARALNLHRTQLYRLKKRFGL
jgi:transcriptional regulator with GAF, ATPase, and Fis domain